MHSKQKNKPSVGVEFRAGGDPHRSEKPGWSAGDMRQWPKQKMHSIPYSQGSFNEKLCTMLFKKLTFFSRKN